MESLKTTAPPNGDIIIKAPAETACRFCGTMLEHSFANLGETPLANAYIHPEKQHEPELRYPLHAFVCHNCFLVQLGVFESPQKIFEEYAYFSSFSESWLAHCQAYTQHVIGKLNLGQDSTVIEIASNDGYLLQYFIAENIPVLGIEPAANIAAYAQEKGIPTRVAFFGSTLAEHLVSEGQQADLVIANNVLAHVPDLNDFIRGIKLVLKPTGVFSIEFPHLLRLIEEHQFDTIYHEHFSYFSLLTVESIMKAHGLTVFDAEPLPTHGGSLRLYGQHTEGMPYPIHPRVEAIKQQERNAGLEKLETYQAFHQNIQTFREHLRQCLQMLKAQGKTIVGYGAPAKGNTLLNYCGIGPELIDYTVDRSPHKQNLLLPGTRIPIYSPEKVFETRPDILLILPWNLKDEIMQQMAGVREWGCQFLIPIPKIEIVS